MSELPPFSPFSAGSIVSVNVSQVRTIDMRGKAVETGILKSPVAGRVRVEGVNLAGDDQADRNVHGGPERAVYAYASEDYAWWAGELGDEVPHGKFGENLTLRGVDVDGARIGERWRAGSTILQVTAPRVPCYKLATVMGDPAFVKRFAEALHPGAYLAIVEPGDLAAGDAVEIVSRPEHDLTIASMTRIYFFERERIEEMLVPELPNEWRAWVAERRAKA